MTTWIDLTDLCSWRGSFTGIQRVVYMYAKQYVDKPSHCYFYFDERTRLIRQIEFSHVESQVLQPPSSLELLGSSVKKSRWVKTISEKALFLKTKLRIQNKLRFIDFGLLFHVVNKIRKCREFLSDLAINSYIHRNKIRPVIFKQDDTVCIFGAGWHTKGMIASVIKQRFDTDFKLVHIVYDLIPVYFPQLFGPGLFEGYTRYLFDAISISDHLVAISESTKSDIARFCNDTGLRQPPTDVIRLGENFEPGVNAERPELIDGTQKYILCVGTIEVRKNHQLLYAAYKQAQLDGVYDLPKLVIVGRHGWLVNDLLHLIENDETVKTKFTFLKEVNDAQLEWLYRHCAFTIYPSLYEGWGLPIAESLARNKFCLASNTSSMPEIAKDLVEYFSPYDPIGCLNLIRKYNDNEQLLMAKEEQIRSEYRPTSWASSFQQLDELIGQSSIQESREVG